MFDQSSPKFGLPPEMLIPIAGSDVASIEKYVGTVENVLVGKNGRTNALSILPYVTSIEGVEDIPIKSDPRRGDFESRLFPVRQIWVHVDYGGYRKAYTKLGGSVIPDGFVLDHVQNREVVRLRWYSHPYLRLCPVSAQVNTSGGHLLGGEGLEKAFVKNILSSLDESMELKDELKSYSIIYADPMDITKMLNIPPGTHVLDGVRDVQNLFYPR